MADFPSNSGFRDGILSIVQEFSRTSAQFKKWRKCAAGKKAVGQDECDTSLHEARKAIEEALKRFSVQHGEKFDAGDEASRARTIQIRKKLSELSNNLLTHASSAPRKSGTKLVPVALRVASEAARKDTLLVMKEMSNKILAEPAHPFRAIDPGDVLPRMPLPPVRPQSNPNSSRFSLNTHARQNGQNNPDRERGSANSSQSSLPAPANQNAEGKEVSIYSPAAGWARNDSVNGEDFGTALARKASAQSTFGRWFSPRPVREYYDIVPLSPTPPVVPSLKCDEDSWDVLKEGEAAVQKAWAVVSTVSDSQQPLDESRFAPFLQGPLASLWETEPVARSTTPLIHEREATPPSPEEPSSASFASLQIPSHSPYSTHPGKRIRSEPMLQFSTPALRIRRHVSASSNARTG